jgi:hypothetical protein
MGFRINVHTQEPSNGLHARALFFCKRGERWCPMVKAILQSLQPSVALGFLAIL